ncbi:LPS assembly protein LptD [Desulfovibrio sp. OttesenSCG-928-G15]|nr:LPS assembly protein LptD [Desulfovibrio sp. OttesenSCG-928-G15]
MLKAHSTCTTTPKKLLTTLLVLCLVVALPAVVFAAPATDDGSAPRTTSAREQKSSPAARSEASSKASSATSSTDSRAQADGTPAASAAGSDAHVGNAHASNAPSDKKVATFGSPAPNAASAEAPPLKTDSDNLVRWDLTADELRSFNDAEFMEAEGNVLLQRGSEYLKADFARYYSSTKWVYLQGNVRVKTGKDEIKAEEAEFDMRSRVGWLKNGSIFMSDPHTYVSGEHINKHWGDVYSFKQAKVTTCDGDVPAWSMTADEAVVEVDGYARLNKPAFNIKDHSVLAVPYFLVPVKTSRQTGLLMPQMGQSSTKGAYYNQPFFWAINENNDLTVNEFVMGDRGFMHGLEFRSRPASDTTIWARADWMWDKRRVTSDSGEYGGDGLVRKNNERYWVRGMIDSVLPDPAWRFKMDLDYVSDQYFLSEFKNDFSGFNRSRNELFNLFNRDLQEKDQHRRSGFLLSRDWERLTIGLSANYWQDQTLGHGNKPHSEDTTVQQLPQIDAFLHKGKILPDFPLEFQAAGQAVYMHRRTGTRGGRYEFIPKATLPINTRYGSIIANVGVVQTLYDTEKRSRTKKDGDEKSGLQWGDSRAVAMGDIAAFTEFARVFTFDAPQLHISQETVGENRWTALRHSMQPRVEMRYRANEDQGRLPWYSEEDRILPRTELVYSLTNVLSIKEDKIVMAKDPKTGEMVPERVSDYRELASLRLEHSYDYRESTRDLERDTYPRRPSGDVYAELTTQVWENVSFTTRNSWSPYMGTFTRHQSGINLAVPAYGDFYFGYDKRKKVEEYDREQRRVNYLSVGFKTAQVGAWSLGVAHKYDYKNHDNYETDLDLIYNHQCFKLIGRVNIEPQEENYQLLVQITGLGD